MWLFKSWDLWRIILRWPVWAFKNSLDKLPPIVDIVIEFIRCVHRYEAQGAQFTNTVHPLQTKRRPKLNYLLISIKEYHCNIFMQDCILCIICFKLSAARAEQSITNDRKLKSRITYTQSSSCSVCTVVMELAQFLSSWSDLRMSQVNVKW